MRIPLCAEELWVTHYSCADWRDPDRWIRYLADSHQNVGARITHLDVTDPVRRRVEGHTFEQLAEYIIESDDRNETRWLFGKMVGGISFTLQIQKEIVEWPHSLKWYFPPRFFREPDSFERLVAFFRCGAQSLQTFYGYSDELRFIKFKKRQQGAVDIQSELPGVFWLTYFGAHYAQFIGQASFSVLAGERQAHADGVTLRLADCPSNVPFDLRRKCELALNPDLFADPTDTRLKRPGQYSLTFRQLRGHS
jgi:hypothetical protein